MQPALFPTFPFLPCVANTQSRVSTHSQSHLFDLPFLSSVLVLVFPFLILVSSSPSQTAESVILVFSVNQSGHFQGYARMASPIGRSRSGQWSENEGGGGPWGGDFAVEWLQLYDLSFSKTLHLRNPLNEMKPIKISRDGQELPAEIGEVVCALMDEGAESEGRGGKR